jgi:Family of unknown function (DUF5681)
VCGFPMFCVAARHTSHRPLRHGAGIPLNHMSYIVAQSIEEPMTEETTTERKPHRAQYKPGQSGNAAGRPRGAKGDSAKHIAMAARLANKLGAKKLSNIVKVLTDAAEAGDVHASSLLLARIWPPPKTRLLSFPMPEIRNADDVRMAQIGFMNGVASGLLTVDEAEKLSAMAERAGQAIAEAAFEHHLERIQESLPKQIEVLP